MKPSSARYASKLTPLALLGETHIAVTLFSFLAGCLALWFYITADHFPIGRAHIWGMLVVLWVINLTPFFADHMEQKFDPFDIKYPFLIYYFFVFTLHSTCRILWGGGSDDLIVNPNTSDPVRLRALCSMVVGLAAFVCGSYSAIARLLGKSGPLLRTPPGERVLILAIGGLVGGGLALSVLLRKSGGVLSFFENLSSWRTTGVLEGVGHLTFPIATVMPASALLLFLASIRPAPAKIKGWGTLSIGICFLTILPVAILGFRVGVVIVLIQIAVGWHYSRKKIGAARLGLLGIILLCLLSGYAAARHKITNERDAGSPVIQAVIFRVPGLDTVERVLWRLDQGEPHKGIASVATEAATIVGPRVLWPNKPQPTSLAFADIFFFDYFLGRGDQLHSVRSGISPTLIGELLWIGGIPSVASGALLLGIVAGALRSWRERRGPPILRNWLYALALVPFAMFVEAPQNTLNGFVLLGLYCASTVFILVIRSPLDRMKC